MPVSKLSAIASSGANLTATDTLIGVHGGNTDLQFTGAQLFGGVAGDVAFANVAGVITATLITTQPGPHTLQGAIGFTGAVASLANGTASVGASATLGGLFTGQGSTNDITFQNKSGTTILSVATGTINVSYAGASRSASGSAGAPSWSYTASTGTGWYFTNSTQAWADAGAFGGYVYSGGVLLRSDGQIGWLNNTDGSGSIRTVVTSPAAAALQLGAANAASPVAQTLQVQGASSSGTSGANWTLIGSLAWGNAGGTNSGDVIIKTGVKQASAQATGTTALTIKGETQRIVASAPIGFASYTVATLPAGVQGDNAYVTDALAPTFLAAVVGGGTVKSPVFYDGTNWVGA